MPRLSQDLRHADGTMAWSIFSNHAGVIELLSPTELVLGAHSGLARVKIVP